MGLIERDQEMDRLGGLFAECLEGHGGLALINGPVATGKTDLLLTMTGQANSGGAHIMTAFAARPERTLPFGLLSQLFRQVSLVLATEQRVQRLLDDGGRLALLHDTQSEALEQVLAPTFHELSTALLDASERVPLVIAVDDVQHADVASLFGLFYLVRRIATARVEVMLTVDPFAQPTVPGLSGALSRLPRCRTLRLRPLSPEGTAALLKERLSERAAERLADRVHAISGGNPLLIVALAEDQRMGSQTSETEPVIADAFEQAVLGCFYRGEPAMLQYARALAILRDSAPRWLCQRLAQLGPVAADQAERELTEAGLLTDRGFRHPMVGATVRNSMTAHERAELDEQAARLLYEDGSPARVIAPHLTSANLRSTWAVQTLQEASDLSLAEGNVTSALKYLHAAQQASVEQHQRTAILLALNRVVWRVDPAIAVRHLEDLTEAAREGKLDGSQALAPLPHLLWHGRVDEAVGLFNDLATAPGLNQDARAAHDLHTIGEWLSCLYPTREVRSVDKPSESTPHDPAAPRLDVATVVLPRAPTGEEHDHDWVSSARRFLRHAKLTDDNFGKIVTALSTLCCADHLEEAIAHCEAMLADSASGSAPTWRAVLTAVQAEIRLRQGDVLAAETKAMEALGIVSRKGWGVAIGLPIGTLVRAAIAAEKLDLAAEHLEIPVPTAMFESLPGLQYLYARARFNLATGHHDAVLPDLEMCANLMTSWGVDWPGLVPWRIDLAAACARLGDEARATALLEEQLRMVQPEQMRLRGMTLRALADVRDIRKRPVLLKEAINALRKSSDRLELAYAFADLSRALFCLGDRDRARAMQRAAHHMARQCNALSLVRSLSVGGRGRDGVGTATQERPAAVTELSAAERRVASLAAMGHTNREIASKLYVTVSTVEQHLTRVYRKLRVDRRNLPPGLHLDVADAI